jgi:hypothetical protein
LAKIEHLEGGNGVGYNLAMPRPIRSTRSTRINYAESVGSVASDNDSEYSPYESETEMAAVIEVRRSSRLLEKKVRETKAATRRTTKQ